eukprot:CAMPEP_0168729322 /NCGR_PEP_ID=MMETSP0724-20121128/6140_1 /TAXON_ID=265536 /ORGANISM="Amphiprora sp., Strain CCMP467" /LENGTH=1037 /DNA_ID=CAMNT_0008776195 /DNA_START=8 /DNA_END=3121 /DNA_ORIENTATION=-
MTEPSSNDDDTEHGNAAALICRTLSEWCIQQTAKENAETEQALHNDIDHRRVIPVEILIGTALRRGDGGLKAQPLNEAKTNLCYKVSLDFNRNDEHTTTSSQPQPQELALFVKQTQNFARWHPGHAFPLTRTDNEAKAMRRAETVLSPATTHSVCPRVVTVLDIVSTSLENETESNDSNDNNNKSKLLVTEWQDDTQSLADWFLQPNHTSIDERVISNLAVSLATLNVQPIQDPNFNSTEVRPLLQSCWPLVQNLFREALKPEEKDSATLSTPWATESLDDRCQVAMRQLTPAGFDEIMQRADHAYVQERQVWGHGDAHVFNFLVQQQQPGNNGNAKENMANVNSTTANTPTVILCDWEMSLVQSSGKDGGYFLGFPIACALCHAASGRPTKAFEIQRATVLFWESYSKILRDPKSNHTERDMCQVYRSMIAWTGICLFPTYYLMKLFADIWPLSTSTNDGDDDDDDDDDVRRQALASMGVLGLRAMEWGFPRDVEPNVTLEELQQRFQTAFSDEIRFLCDKRRSENSKNSKKNDPAKKTVEVGARGVQLKHFEIVVKNLLSKVTIEYSNLPPLSLSNETKEESSHSNSDVSSPKWPFIILPPQAQVHGSIPGQIADQTRARRKEDQLQNMIRCVLFLLEETSVQGEPEQSSPSTTTTLVDFGGGSGHLAIPLALLLPHCRVIVVDLSNRSLELLHEKARLFKTNEEATTASPLPTSTKLRASTIPNLYTFHGPVQDFDESKNPFDVGIALHLCGEATDVALRKCGQAGARAMVFCPCCVGKLNRNRKNPYIWQSTGSNTPTVEYPQSSLFQQCFVEDRQKDWNALAKAADYGDAEQSRTCRNAARRCAKSLLETDRKLFLEEAYGYQTALTRMEPWEATPKNDILLAWKPSANSPQTTDTWINPNEACHKDIETTQAHLIDVSRSPSLSAPVEKRDAVDWTLEEQHAIHRQIETFFLGTATSGMTTSENSDEPVMIFPHGMGRRQRKLIHYVAAQLKLQHWSVSGNGSGEKTVAVGRKRRRLRPADKVMAQNSDQD